MDPLMFHTRKGIRFSTDLNVWCQFQSYYIAYREVIKWCSCVTDLPYFENCPENETILMTLPEISRSVEAPIHPTGMVTVQDMQN